MNGGAISRNQSDGAPVGICLVGIELIAHQHGDVGCVLVANDAVTIIIRCLADDGRVEDGVEVRELGEGVRGMDGAIGRVHRAVGHGPLDSRREGLSEGGGV